MFLGGCPCCGKKECWRCYEFDYCNQWDLILQSKLFLSFTYAGTFDDVNGQFFNSSFDCQTQKTIEFLPGESQKEIEINGINHILSFDSNQFRTDFSFGAAYPGSVPTGLPSGGHGIRIQQGYCNTTGLSSSFRIDGLTPGAINNVPFLLENFNETINGNLFYELPEDFGSVIGFGANYLKIHECTVPTPMDAPIFPESPSGEFGLSYLLKMRPPGFPSDLYDLCPLQETFSITEFYSEEYGNLLVELPTESFECEWTR